jgi:hypothetical protein
MGWGLLSLRLNFQPVDLPTCLGRTPKVETPIDVLNRFSQRKLQAETLVGKDSLFSESAPMESSWTEPWC